MSDKQTMTYRGSMRVEAAAAYLDALAQALRDRHIALTAEGESVDIDVADDVLFDFHSKSTASKGKATLELTVSWRRINERNGSNPDLVIASRQATPAPSEQSQAPVLDE